MAFLAPNLPTLDPILIDARVLAFSLVVAVATGLAFGLAPALQLSRIELTASLKETARAVSETGRRRRLRGLLVVAEVAFAMVLLSAAGLFWRSFFELRGVDGGYQTDHVLTLTVDLAEAKYKTAAEQVSFFRQALERIQGLPQVVSAGITTSPPFSMYRAVIDQIAIEGRPAAPASLIDIGIVSPDYFRTLGIPVLAGRDLAPADRAGAPSVVLVNETFARKYCPEAGCVGQRLANWEKPGDSMTIVGVVRDARTYPERPALAGVYPCYLQTGAMHLTFVVRSALDPLALAPAVRARIAGVDPTQPAHDIATLEQATEEHFTPYRVTLVLAVAFAALALGLGAVGIYGVISYSVRCRTHEMGVRLALGARPAEVLLLVLRSGMALVGIGMVVGVAASLGLTRLIASELWGVSPSDPKTLASVSLVLVAAGCLACLVPAVRAAKVDPMRSLRCE